jgi:hypothetical protein
MVTTLWGFISMLDAPFESRDSYGSDRAAPANQLGNAQNSQIANSIVQGAADYDLQLEAITSTDDAF